MTEDRSNHRLNVEIERFIDIYDATSIGCEIKAMFENGTSYESICERMDINYDEYKDE